MRPRSRRTTWPLAVTALLGGCGHTTAGGFPDDGSAAADDAGAAQDAIVEAGPPAEAGRRDAAAPRDAGAEAASDAATPPDAGAPDAQPTTLDLHQVTLFDNPANLADWPETTQITAVDFQYQGSDGVHVAFSKQDGPGSWPDVTPPGWTGPLEYTLGMIERVNGLWVGSAAIQYWRGLAASGGNVASDTVTMGPCLAFGAGSTCQVAKNWYYDGRWGPLAGVQPATGELVGIFVVAGNVRGVTDGSQSPVQERSNVVLVAMPGFAGATYAF